MKPISVNRESFDVEVRGAEGAVLVDFYADWCGPCRLLAPTLEQIAMEHKVVKVNVDEAPELAEEFSVMSSNRT